MICTKITQRALLLRKYSQSVSRQDLVFEHLPGKDQGIAVLGLNRPKQRNAFGGNLVKEIGQVLDEIHYESNVRVLVLRSMVSGVFCAGADLKERLTMPQTQVEQSVTNLRNLMDRVYNLPIPVIAAMDGLALGGGLEISLACDLRIASSDTKMGLVEGKLAIIPGAGGTQRLPRLINPAIAKELIYTARIIDAKAALNLGILNHMVEQNQTGNGAFLKSLDIAREILPNGPVAVRMAKKAVNRGLETDLKNGLIVEGLCYKELVGTKDRIEGLQAFSEKRAPNYTGE